MGQIKVEKTLIEGLYVIEPTVHFDSRGYFMETYSLRDMELNLLIGTAYLRMLYMDLNSNFVVATAAYNAGPAKARVWRSILTQPMEAAIFIETIPYYETRGYVKNVLANMHTYAHRLHQPIKRFKAFLGEVSPGSTAASALP